MASEERAWVALLGNAEKTIRANCGHFSPTCIASGLAPLSCQEVGCLISVTENL